ncbi:hypothetical protein OROMI_004569 [Orobanche minor]
MCGLLVSKKLHAASPMMATRIFAVLRTCYQIDQGTWIVAEISPDSSNGRYFHRLPSGCLIERITEDQSKVTWVEHTEVVTTLPNQTSAFAFGAQRMAAWLERYCEKTSLMEATYTLETQGIDVPMNQEKFMLMEFGDTMVHGLFRNISPIEYNTGSSLLSSVEDLRVHASVYKSFYNAQVVGAMVAFPVKHSPEFVLRTLADSRKHHQWDVLGGFKKLSKPRRHSTGGDPKNNISVSVIEGGSSSSSNEMLLIKEVDVNLSGSLVVWSTVSKTYFDHLISSGDVISKDSMLVSGFSITTDNHNTFGGSVITLVLRMPVEEEEEEEEGKRQSLQEKEKQTMMESITLAIIKTVERVKEALDKRRLPPPPPPPRRGNPAAARSPSCPNSKPNPATRESFDRLPA